ncbi:hypothetical protein NUW54_g10319 [Trametes sanguinea]|uniref:Uncharacterized protein n=1 Tax=Trametes sanguinea TaxID=158606 RepID=A0ACC1P1D8_9APHY|nr:hypothetical protein NUW54_g10319 [Trametes sanguinea]
MAVQNRWPSASGRPRTDPTVPLLLPQISGHDYSQFLTMTESASVNGFLIYAADDTDFDSIFYGGKDVIWEHRNSGWNDAYNDTASDGQVGGIASMNFTGTHLQTRQFLEPLVLTSNESRRRGPGIRSNARESILI